jgi:branched-chain amino acid transport system substrate-binding protein
MMKRATAVSLLVGVIAMACETGPGPTNAPDIIIASDMPRSAFPADAGPWQQAIDLAIRQKGSVAGYTLGYWPLDDSLSANQNPLRGINNVGRMIENPRVLGMVGPFNSGIAYVEIPVAGAADLAMLSPSNTNSCVTLEFPFCGNGLPPRLYTGHPNNYFRLSAPDAGEGRAMALYVTRQLKNVTRVAILNEWDEIGRVIIKAFASVLAASGVEVVLQQDLDPTTTDFSDFLKKASALRAEAIYAVGDGAVAPFCAAAAQTKALVPGALFMVTDGVATNSQCIKDAGADNAEGMLGTYMDVDPRVNKDTTVSKEVDSYLKAYPKATDVTSYTFAAYDAARIMIDAIARAIEKNHGGFPKREQVVAALAETADFKGVTGTYSFDSKGDTLSPLMSLWKVENGQWVDKGKIDAAANAS